MNKNKPERSQFSLTKLKLEKESKGVEVGFTIETVIGAERFYDAQTFKSVRIPHPDLITKVQALLPTLLVSLERSEDNDSMQKYKVTGLHVSGEVSKGVIITSTFACLNETKVSILSPRIKLDKPIWGIEDELEAHVKEIEDEAYEYVFENKQAQLTMEFGE